jgi:hypothetical protein
VFEPGAPENYGAGYNYIATTLNRYQNLRDPITQERWPYDGSNFWTYDDFGHRTLAAQCFGD